MQHIQIGDDGAVLITWLVAGMTAALGLMFLFVLIKGALPRLARTGGADLADPGKLLGLVAVFVLPALPAAVFAAILVGMWHDVHRVDVEADGTWVLRNPLGAGFERLAADVPRQVELDSYVRSYWSPQGQHLRAIKRTGILVTTEDGRELDLTTNDGGSVLARLGYKSVGGCHVTSTDDVFRIDMHTVDKRGPVCPEPDVPGAAPLRVDDGDDVFARWSKDGWWYPAKVVAATGERPEVRYADGSTERVATDAVRGFDLPGAATVEGDWKGEGKYFPATVAARGDAGVTLVYEDGTEEAVGLARVRFRLPSKGDPVVAQWAADGWWYAAEVIDAQPGRVRVRYGDGTPEWRPWSAVGRRAIPRGAAVEARGAGADVGYQACTISEAGDGAFDVTLPDGAKARLTWDALRLRPAGEE